ncbi:hypothetical protein BV372_00010 [Nostoc sp. T09]|nr:hypothetical protein BV372_00010 [Nostoc sp. T09]
MVPSSGDIRIVQAARINLIKNQSVKQEDIIAYIDNSQIQTQKASYNTCFLSVSSINFYEM